MALQLCSLSLLLAISAPPPPVSPPPSPLSPPTLPSEPGSQVVDTLEALEAALDDPAFGTIFLSPGTYFLRTSLEIQRSVTLAAAVPSTVLLDGQETTRVITIRGAAVNISGLNISRGFASSSRFGTSTDESSGDIEGNGGGLYIIRSTVLLDDCNVVSNVAALWGGGLIVSFSILTIRGGSVANNTCRDLDGGAVDAFMGADVSIYDCIIEFNRALDGGGIFVYMGSACLTRCLVVGNRAREEGGAFYAGSGANLTVLDCIVADNAAQFGGGFSIPADSNGRTPSTVLASNVTIRGNVANTDGGGLSVFGNSGKTTVSLVDSKIEANVANLSGGGLMIAGATTTLHRTVVHGNVAPTGAEIQPLAGYLYLTLPLSPGHWLPNTHCVVNRVPCSVDGDGNLDEACEKTRHLCSITYGQQPIVEYDGQPHQCERPDEVQPCSWRSQPDLLGERVYLAPYTPVSEPFPYPCRAGVVGSADSDEQTSSNCAGKCPSGSFCPSEATLVPLTCPPGSFCDEGATTPRPCPSGTFSASAELSSEAECSVCPEGSFCAVGSTSPTPCAAGTISAVGAATCTPCEGGTFQAESNATACFPCEGGGYCPEGASTVLLCPAGSYSQATNLTAAAECQPCPAGSSCPAGSPVPTPCARGTSFAVEESGTCTSCRTCGRGEHEAEGCKEATDRTCQPVDANHYSAEGSNTQAECFNLACPSGNWRRGAGCSNVTGEGYDCVACTSCGGGQRERTGCNATADRTCQPVDAGHYSAEGSNTQSECFNVICPSGNWQRGAACSNVTGEGYDCISCSGCGGGERERTGCNATADRTCQPVDDDHYSAEGSSTQSECFNAQCPNGTFRTGACDALTGVGYACEACDDCGAGKYEATACDAVRGAFVQRTCQDVGRGYYSPRSDNERHSCAMGTAQPSTGGSSCEPCEPGTHASEAGQTECVPCERGLYAAQQGLSFCARCLHRTSSSNRSISCNTCAAGFYRLDASVPATPDACAECPDGASCPWNATLATLELDPAMWRLSPRSSLIVQCIGPRASRCRGGGDAGVDGAGYCSHGYYGPACQLCTEANTYFGEGGECLDCPPIAERLAIGAVLALGLLVALLGAVGVYRSRLDWRTLQAFRRLVIYIGQLGLVVKLKIIFAFMQVAVSLNTIYDAQLPASYTAWFASTFSWAGLDFVPQLIPAACVDQGYQVTLLVAGLTPIGLIAAAAVGFVARRAWGRGTTRRFSFNSSGGRLTRRGIVTAGLLDAAPFSLVLTFYCVSGVSQTVFAAFLCVAYDEDSEAYTTRSFLRADLSVACDDGGPHERIKALAYVFVALWPIGVLVLYAALLLKCGPRLRHSEPNALTRATAFLHRGVETRVYYWEVVELLRRTTLIGWVLLIPAEQAFARLVLGLLVSIAYLIALLTSTPYVSSLDDHLANGCATALVFVFLSATLIRTHQKIAETFGSEAAKEIMVFEDPAILTAVLIGLCFSALALLLVLTTVHVRRERREEREAAVWAAQTLNPPTFHWRPTRHYATFLSHYKMECASDARYLYDVLRKVLRAPIFLDSSNLADLRTLFTDGIHQSDTVLLMATKGVLTRPWCMLEILEARRRDVPIVLLVIQTKGFDAVQMREYIDHLEARLVVSNPSALQLLHKQVGDDLSELRAAMRSVLQEQEEGERLVWNPHAGDNEIIANLKDLVQSMAAATGRQGRLDWKEGPKKALSLRDVFGSKGDRSYAAYIACHHEEAVAEARVLQTALSKRCGRRVTIGTPAAALHMSRGDASAHLASDGVVLLLTKSTLHTPHCLTAIARAIYARKPIISILLTGRGYDFSAGQSLLRNLGEQLGAERLSELEEQLRVARLRSLANVARFSALGHFLPPAARLAGLGRQGGNSPSPARGTTAAVRFEEVQAKLLDTIPNLIAIHWFPEGGENQLLAAVEEVACRLAQRMAAAGREAAAARARAPPLAGRRIWQRGRSTARTPVSPTCTAGHSTRSEGDAADSPPPLADMVELQVVTEDGADGYSGYSESITAASDEEEEIS